MKKQNKPEEIICRKCGAKFGEDGRAFEVGKEFSKSLCYLCKLEKFLKKEKK